MKKKLIITLSILAGLLAVVALSLSVRQAQANRQIVLEWQTTPTVNFTLQSTNRLEILPLYEEAGDSQKYITGHGVSYLVRTDSATILVDVGNNPDNATVPPYLQNMQALGITWDEIDAVMISHPHPDHVGGSKAWTNHMVAFGDIPGGLNSLPIYVPAELSYPGAIWSFDPTLLALDMATTGVITYPDVFPLSLLEPKGSEQALVVNVTGEGLVLITGCGHPTIEKLITRTEVLYGMPVVGVVGGLHYVDTSTEDIQPHIQFLAERQPKLIALSPHDSGMQALEAFQAAFPDAYRSIRVGETIQFPD